jgi:integrase
LSSFSVADLNKYIAFLKNPPANWCMPEKKYKRYHIEWRPFNGPLQKNALNYALIVLNSLFAFLENASYIKKNPIKLLQKKQILATYEEQKVRVWERTLDDNEWQAIVNTLSNLPETTTRAKLQKLKTQLLFACLYILGLRIHEAANAKYNNLQYVNNSWWFVLYGKGDKLGTIPVNHQFLEILQAYRHIQNLPADFHNDENYLFTSNTGNIVTTRTLYNMVKHVGLIASKSFDNEYNREKLLNLSPHWLRHLSATHQSRLGTPIDIIKDNHRHSSLQTTEIYMHSDQDLRQQFMQKHTINMEVGLNKSFEEIVKNMTKITLKFLKTNPPAQFIDTITRFVESQLLVGFNVLEQKINNGQELIIIISEKNPQINFASLEIIAKVWGINVEVAVDEYGVA